MDQPSQVYFPKKLVVRETETPEEPQLKDEDIEAVRKAFSVDGSSSRGGKRSAPGDCAWTTHRAKSGATCITEYRRV